MSAFQSRRLIESMAAWLLLACSGLAVELEVEAYIGHPLGVGKAVLRPGNSLVASGFDPATEDVLRVTDEKQRVLYPAHEVTSLRTALGPAPHGAHTLTVYFLFRGDEPFQLAISAGGAWNASVEPRKDDAAHKKLLDAWWERYGQSAQVVVAADAYPPMVENYLLQTLARRLKLDRPPQLSSWTPYSWLGVDEAVALITGAESVRTAAQSKVLLAGTKGAQPADQPLPKAVETPPVAIAEPKGEVAIEPIAEHVPAECFYVRAGSFENFRWLKDSLDRWGTNIRHVSSVRGVDYRLSDRLQKQLALEETVLGKLLGGTVISDVAILGTDTFVREGASLGILFEARSGALLGDQIKGFRENTRRESPDAKERTVSIGGREVLFLATPDNRVRSFYAVDGKYHFVSTSRRLVERFFEAGKGVASLARLPEFRLARSMMPVSDKHVAFVYLSDPFFRVLLSPEYRIEMTRRVEAAAEIDVVRLARLAARAEGLVESGKPDLDPAQLLAAGFLPEGFGRRADGSRVVAHGEKLVDSLRGALGTFLPVADVKITAATRAEADAYGEFAADYARAWRRMDPVIVGVKRQALGSDKGGAEERVTFDVHITPYAQHHYEDLARWLSPADKTAFAATKGTIISIEANAPLELPTGQGGTPAKYYAGLRDEPPKFSIVEGAVRYADQLDFFGADAFAAAAVSKGDSRSALMFFSEGARDADGDVKGNAGSPTSWWYHGAPKFDVVATNKKILREVVPQLAIVDAPRPAKIRVRVADLSQSQLAPLINAESYLRSRRVSAGNVHFVNTLVEQLHLPLDKADGEAERLLGARPVCPLGGRYVISGGGFTGVRAWRSTAWKTRSVREETSVPAGYHSPLFDWFAGATLDFDIDANTLTTHIELDVRK